ncbi:MAG: hypothetical protein HOQ12_13040 [Gemmatimonadaceae bacterium]|nr:hypothetical protein [Gemmatimonadaceae bacterium]NUQ94977.1 hypothetical protein [Gemmatimonadaceae bacterium]NUR20452.1 hypothetical protein [Gemmatimonadaceae bacterium]
MRSTIICGLAILAGVSLGACIPYSVGSTARTVPAGEHTRASTAFVIPNGFEAKGDTTAATMPGLDTELRYGIDDRSDFGVRVPSWSGVVVNYKHRVDAKPAAAAADTGVAVAVMAGGGFVNWGQHAEGELSLIVSAREDRRAVPYGGLRVVQVVPLSSDVPSDRPTAGGFLGLRLGGRDAGVTPEIGIYYDHSALGIRRSDLIIVPSITFRGDFLSSLFH